MTEFSFRMPWENNTGLEGWALYFYQKKKLMEGRFNLRWQVKWGEGLDAGIPWKDFNRQCYKWYVQYPRAQKLLKQQMKAETLND